MLPEEESRHVSDNGNELRDNSRLIQILGNMELNEEIGHTDLAPVLTRLPRRIALRG